MLRSLCVAALVAISLCSSSFAADEVPSGPGDWPQWRGPHRTNLSDEKGLAREWPADGPPVLWSVDTVGVGYSSMAVKDGLLLTQGDIDGVEHIICLNIKDGSTVWAVQPEPVAVALKTKIESELKRLDKNGDGTIDESEALTGLGSNFFTFDKVDSQADAKKLAADRVAKILKAADSDADGKLSFAEAGKLYQKQFGKIDTADRSIDAAALAKLRTDEVLKAADKNGDGELSKNECNGTALQDGFNQADKKDPAAGKGDDKLTREEIENFFGKSEAGRDGLLSATELTTFYEQQQAGKDGVLSEAELKGFLGGYRNSYGDGPRGTPTIDGKLVYAEGGNGDLTCLELATGKTVWHKNLSTDFGGGRPGWGYAESPLVVDEWVIVTPGGAKGTLAALNKLTGDVVWRSSDTEGAHYASCQVATIAGVKQIVQCASKNIFGVRLSDGKLLWTYSKANNGTANATTPIIHGDYIYGSSGYGTGGGLVKVSAKGDEFVAEEVYFDKTLANHHGGVLLFGDHIYGFGTGLVCQNFLTGENAWKARSVTKGSLTYADGLLFLLGENHTVALADADYAEYREKGRFSIENLGRPSWAHPIVAGGVMYIRNMQKLTAYDVRAK